MIFLKKENKNATFLSWKSFFIRMKNKGGMAMNKKGIRSVMTGALALSLIVPAVPANAASKVTYKVKGTTLTISGKGEMPKSMVFGKKSKTKNIKKVVIKKVSLPFLRMPLKTVKS